MSSNRFPFPMPFGWFKVALSPELGTDTLLTRHYFCTELVVSRAAAGDPVCQEAFCAHLGAHLGVGGSVRDGCIQCPFHGWVYDASGANVAIPYADQPNRKARLRTFPTVERGGIVFAWYHPQCAGPLWDVMDIAEYDDPEYGDYEVFDYTIGSCMQEIGENGFDQAHFQFVHSHPKVGTTEKVEFDGYDRVVLSSQQFPSSKGAVDARIDVFGRGPGFAITRYQGLIDASLVGCSTTRPRTSRSCSPSAIPTATSTRRASPARSSTRSAVRSVRTSRSGSTSGTFPTRPWRPLRSRSSSTGVGTSSSTAPTAE